MADQIFGEGHSPIPFVLVATPAVIPAFAASPKPIYIEGLGNVSAVKGAAVANATDAATALTQLNALLVSLRAAGLIA